MSELYPLTVTNIVKETRHAVVVTLVPRPEDVSHFAYKQGQYLTFEREFEGEALRRSYSICAGLRENQLKVGIKKVDDGWFSSWANEELKVGDVLPSMPPQGRFFTPLEPERAKNYLLFAAGSGITPILSLARTILEEEPQAKIILIYMNRSFNTIMFREALSDLKDRFMTRFSVLHILEHDAGDIDMLSGRVDAEKLDNLFTQWMSPKATDTAFICGPKPLMFLISERLQAHGMAKENVKFELFASTPPKKARAKTTSSQDKKDVRVTVIRDGQTRIFDMARNGETLLEAGAQEGVDMPFSCKAGVCSTCICKVTTGNVEMMSNYALEDYEVERGLTLACQALPLSDEITLTYDEH